MSQCTATRRHQLIKKLVRITVVTTGLFCIGSIIYSIAQERYASRIEANRNVAAFRIALLLDKEFLSKPLEKAARKCSIKKKLNCNELLDLLIQARNRATDYKIFLVNTVGVTASDSRIRKLDAFAEKINVIPKAIFGMSISEASEAKIRSTQEYFSHARNAYFKIDSRKAESVDIDADINNLFEYSSQFLREIEAKNGSGIIDAKNASFQWLAVIILAEIFIFILVNGSDLIINNSSPGNGNEFMAKEIQPKVIPLTLSIVFGMGLMVLGELMLVRQTSDVLLGECREHNQQSISFMNRIGAMEISRATMMDISRLVELPSYCVPFVASYQTILTKISSSGLNTVQLIGENAKSGLIEYADSFQLAQHSRSKINGVILQIMLLLNVISLLSLAVFLHFDSAELG